MPPKKGKSVQERLEEEWKEYLAAEKGKKFPNIMLIGISGAGKSSLVNKVFGVDIAATSNTAPKTKDYVFYNGNSFNRKINLIDSAGYELGQSEDFLDDTIEAINKEYDGGRVNVIWYCIPLNHERIEPINLRVIKELYNEDAIRGRLCIVFTHCDEDDDEGSNEKDFINVLLNHGMGAITRFSVCTNDKAPHQLNELILWSSGKMEEQDLRYSFISSQMQNLDLKRIEAQRIIDETCTITAFSKVFDQIIDKDRSDDLEEIQIKMITKIFGIYGLDCLEGLSKSFEQGTGISRAITKFLDRFSKIITKAVFKKESIAAEFANRGIKVSVPIALTKAIGSLASNESYKYVKAHINGTPVRFEELFSDPDHASFIKLILQDVLDPIKGEANTVNPDSSEVKEESSSTNKKGRPSNKQKARRKGR